jgi:phage terminase large subunit-like protein
MDPAGGRKIDKNKARFRIDGAVALTMALGLKSRDRQEVEGPSVYETRGIRMV